MQIQTTKKLTADAGKLLDKSGPGPDLGGLGERTAFNEGYGLMAIDVVLDDDYHTNAKSFVVPFDCVIKHAFARGKALSASGAATIRRNTTTIAGPITMAADTVPTFSGVLVDAGLALTAGETLNAITVGANDRGVVTLLVVRT